MNEEEKITYNEIKKTEKKDRKISLEIQIIGWAGTLILILAYSLNSLGYITAQNLIYPILNLLAAILLAIRVWVDRNWSNLFIEAFWAAVAIISLINFFTF